jgi:DNA-binding NarL/FixJ family response regulator
VCGTEFEGWVFVRRGALPDAWRERATETLLVPLLPGEGAQLFSPGRVSSLLKQTEERLARLVARGLRVTDIAAELGVNPRTVERQLTALRQRVGARSLAELRNILARAGM